MKIRAVCLGFLGLVQGFQTLQRSTAGKHSIHNLNRLHVDLSNTPFRPKKWLEKFSRNKGNDFTAADSNDVGENSDAVPMMANDESILDIDNLDQLGNETAAVNADQASLGAAALAAGLTVALDVGFLDVATKMELAATFGLMANFFTTKPTGTAGELLQSTGVFLTSSAAAAVDLFQNISATVSSNLPTKAEPLGAIDVTELPTTGAAEQEEVEEAGSTQPAGQALSAIGVREGFAASESATRRLMRPDLSNGGGESPGGDVGIFAESQELHLADDPEMQLNQPERRGAGFRRSLQRIAQSRVIRVMLAVSIAGAIFTTTGKA